jgi:HAD superfamily hydrolase (TIGR01549 family)
MTPKRKTELKAVIFDFDGVIANSFERQYAVFQELAKKFSKTDLSKEEFKRKIWGNSIRKTFQNYFKGHAFEDVQKEYNRVAIEFTEKLEIMHGADDVLKKIKEKKIKMALVSNALRGRLENDTKALDVSKFFDVIVAGDDVEKPKPYPDPILKACNSLKVAPDEIMYVGDTKHDYQAGKAAGAFVVGLNTEGDLVIDKLSDLLELV